MKIFKRLPAFMGVLMLGAAMTIAAVGEADARKGGGFGSRGARTDTAPAATSTAPNTAAPIQRSATPAQTQTANAAGATRGGLFGGGFAGSMLRGLAIGGLIGLLLGNGLGGLAGMFGLLLQVGLVALVAFLAYRFFAGRRQQAPAPAGAGGSFGLNRGMFDTGSQGTGQGRSALGGFGGMGGGGTAPGGAPAGAPQPDAGFQSVPQQRVYQPAPNRKVKDELGLTGDDFGVFEQRLAAIQDAFTREDRTALSRLATSEVVEVLGEELDRNAAQGLRNEVRDVKLVQGDLSEAWREDAREYATVAMRYSMVDVMRDRASGALAPGSSETPEEVTEVWTFVRPRGGQWMLSAIQDV